jgi:peptidyl-prolyl cis-trans isomerase A (cyclophilin A)
MAQPTPGTFLSCAPAHPRIGVRRRLAGAILLAFVASASTGFGTQDTGIVRVLVETELGEIEIELDGARAPVSTANFLRYVDGGFYDGGRFHRSVRLDNQNRDDVLIEVIQASNPDSEIPEAEPIPLERTSETGLKHLDGTISMARGGPDTARSSFFICINDQPSLDFGGARNADGQGFAAFGKVVRGMDVVRRIHESPTERENLTPPIGIIRVSRVH